ncbi:MAG: AI-2E family transporter [Gallionella sp.]|nr:AI-2E family transporter [Gallionella sp.]
MNNQQAPKAVLQDERSEVKQALPRLTAMRIEIAPWTIVFVVLIIISLWLFIRLLPVFLMLVCALMIAGTLSPTVDRLERRGIRRDAGIAIVFSVLFVITGLLFLLIVPELLNQVKNVISIEPEMRKNLAHWLARSPLTENLAKALRNVRYDTLFKASASSVLSFFSLVIESIIYGVGAIFLALYMMLDRDRLRGALFSVVPRTHHIRLSRILVNLNTIVGGYIRGQAITCALMAAFIFILLTACGIPNALVIAVFGGLADVLPYIGIFLTMAPAVAAALPLGAGITLVVFLLMLAYEEFESRVLVPVVYGRAMRLPSSMVLLSLIAGATLFGIIGALLALPVAATILMLIDTLRVELPGETEQAADTENRENDQSSEQEYTRRTDGMSAGQASAIAFKMSRRRKIKESLADK